MIHRGPGFLVFLLLPSPAPPSPVSGSTGDTQKDLERQLADGREGRVGEEPNDVTARKPGLL
jgi:hypothetical protein